MHGYGNSMFERLTVDTRKALKRSGRVTVRSVNVIGERRGCVLAAGRL
jgi:hypothetical protein